MDKIPFGCRALDELMEGGAEAGSVTLVYGEAGTGKTNLCLVLSRNVARLGRKVLFLDTEGVSLERYRQICGQDFEAVLRSTLISEVHSFEDQERMVERAVKLAEANLDVGMIVVDSVSMYYRLTSREDDKGERKSLTAQSLKLLGVARKRGIPVLLTSQVYTDVEHGTFEPLGGHPLMHNAKTLLKLEKVSIGRRRAVLMKHRHIEEGRSAEFRLVRDGIEC
ncbi:MAG: DNA repair and recombination protein RadB [Methanomassiliicoccales archaeon]|nr:DNA repair and recombination protein RadB [Methanomassiliicoccales archaeon]